MPSLNDFVRKEITTMSIFLAAKAERTAVTIEEYIQASLAQGIDPDTLEQNLLNDLENGGRIFGEFRNAVRATANGVIGRSRSIGLFDVSGTEQKYRWVAVLINTCPDCLDRHGKILTWDEWESEGLPQTGQTVCKEYCQCVLIPADGTEVNPIRRNKR